MAYEQRVRRDKMVAELTAAKKETAFYARKVEQAKAIEAMEERHGKKRARAREGETGHTDTAGAVAAGGEADALQAVRRRFKQRRVAKDAATSDAPSGLASKLLWGAAS